MPFHDQRAKDSLGSGQSFLLDYPGLLLGLPDAILNLLFLGFDPFNFLPTGDDNLTIGRVIRVLSKHHLTNSKL